MAGDYLGVLPRQDPLYPFLSSEVLNKVLGYPGEDWVFDVHRLEKLPVNWYIYRYTERSTGISLVGKFYGNKYLYGGQLCGPEQRARLMQWEFENLSLLRGAGFDQPPFQVVRPLAVSPAINCVLVMEYAAGYDLNHYIRGAIFARGEQELLDRVGLVALFLARLHALAQVPLPSRRSALAYIDENVRQLNRMQLISWEQSRRIEDLRGRWVSSGNLDEFTPGPIHNDAVPSHFVFTGTDQLTLIDLERLTTGDRAVDLGTLVAEIKQMFYWYTGSLWSGERYIRHLYRTYFNCLPPGSEDFESLTMRGRFYMGCTQLRMGLVDWMDAGYRRRLIDDAEACMQIKQPENK